MCCAFQLLTGHGLVCLYDATGKGQVYTGTDDCIVCCIVMVEFTKVKVFRECLQFVVLELGELLLCHSTDVNVFIDLRPVDRKRVVVSEIGQNRLIEFGIAENGCTCREFLKLRVQLLKSRGLCNHVFRYAVNLYVQRCEVANLFRRFYEGRE